MLWCVSDRDNSKGDGCGEKRGHVSDTASGDVVVMQYSSGNTILMYGVTSDS